MLEITDDTAVIADDVAAPHCSLLAPDTAGRRVAAPGVRCGPVVGRVLLLLPLSLPLPAVMMDCVPLLLAVAAVASTSVASSVVIPPVVSGLAKSLDRPLLSLADYTYQMFVAFLLPSKM